MTFNAPAEVQPSARASVPRGRIRGRVLAHALQPEALVLLAIVLFGIGLRLFRLNQLSLWLDEIGEATTATTPFPRFFAEVRIGAGAAPLDYLGVKLTTTLFGHGTIATRLWSLAAGCLLIPMAYLVGRDVFRKKSAGLIAAFMTGVSAFLVYYAQEARFYSLTALVGLVSLYLFNRAFEKNRAVDWLLFALSVVLSLYTHYFLAVLIAMEGFFLGGHWLWTLFRGGDRRLAGVRLGQVGRFVLACIAASVVFVPWLLFATRGQTNFGWPPLPPLDLARFHQIAVVLLALAPLNSNPTFSLTQWIRADAVLVLALIGVVDGLRRGRSQVLLLALTPPVMVVAAWRADVASHYFWSERQVIAALPMIYLLAAGGAAALMEWIWRFEPRVHPANRAQSRPGVLKQSPVLAGVLVALLAIGWLGLNANPLLRVYAAQWNNKEDWRSAAALISSGACPDSHFYSWLDEHSSYGFVYYAPSLRSRTDFLYGAAGTEDVLQAVQRIPLKPTDWLVVTTPSAMQVEGGTSADAFLQARGWTSVEFRGIRVYDHPPTCAAPRSTSG